MNSWQRYCGAFLLVVAAVVIQQSVWTLRLFEDGQPGSGFMPFGLGVLLVALAVLLIIKHRRPDQKRVHFWDGRAWAHPLLAVSLTVLFAVVFDEIGAITSVAVFVFGWLWLVGRKRVVVAVTTGVLTAAVVYLVFERLLQSPFPRGIAF